MKIKRLMLAKQKWGEPRVMFEGVYADGESKLELHLHRVTFELSAELSPNFDAELSIKHEDGLNNVEIKCANLRWK